MEVDDLAPADRLRVDTGLGIDRARDARLTFVDAGRPGDVDRWLRPYRVDDLLADGPLPALRLVEANDRR